MLRSLLVFSVLVPGIVVALFNRFAALLLYLWFALFRPQEWMWWDISALRPSLVLGLVLVVPCLLSGVMPHIAHPLSVGAVVFFCASLMAQAGAISPAIGWAWLDFLFRLLFVCLLTIALVNDQRRFRLTVAVIAGSFGVHAAKAGLASLLGGGTRFFEGFAGAFADNNGYAVGIAMVVPLLVAVGQWSSDRKVRLAFLAAAPLSAFAIVSTFSRGGFLALATGAVVLAAMQRRRGVALAATLVLAIPLTYFMASQEGYLDRLATIRSYEESNDESALGRLHFWRVAINMAADRPLGVGLFNYEAAYDDYDDLNGTFGRGRSVHSSHFQVLAETGFIGLAAWITVFAVGFQRAFRIRRRSHHAGLPPDDQRLFLVSANALIASMAAFLVGGAFVAMALNDLTWLSFALIAALDIISARACQQDRPTGVEVIAPLPSLASWKPRVARGPVA